MDYYKSSKSLSKLYICLFCLIMSKKATKHLNSDRILAKAIKSVGRLPRMDSLSGDVYFDLIRSIAFQQIHGAAATKIFGRFLDLFDEAYPFPEMVLNLEISDLRAVGFSNQKSNYIQNIAEFALQEKIDRIAWKKMADEEIIKYLSQIKGVGVWTVQMVLMVSLRRPDVFPDGDFGIQTAFKKLYKIDDDIKGRQLKEQMQQLAEPWKPYRSYASRYLWAWLDKNKEDMK